MSWDFELPAAYLDLIVLDEAVDPRLRLLDCDPGDGEIDAPCGSLWGLHPTIAFTLADTGGVGVNTVEALVYVDGVLVYDNGSWLASWTGTINSPYAFAERWTCTAPTGFDSLSVKTVRVKAKTSDGGGTIDVTYSFTTEDIVGPTVLAVEVPDHLTLRVTFSEAVYQGDPAVFYSALNPANYELAAQTSPAAPVVVESVEAIDSATVELSLDQELTPLATYRLSFLSIMDEHLNHMGFPGYFDVAVPALDVDSRRKFDLWWFLPELNRREDDPKNGGTGELRKFVSCLSEVVSILLHDVDHWTDILDPDIAPEAHLDAMLVDLGNPFDFDLEEIDKRRLLRVLVQVYREKGTIPGIVNVVRFFLGLTITIRNSIGHDKWVLGTSALGVDMVLGPSRGWDRRGFHIVSPIALTAEQRARVLALATYMKPAGTHILGLLEPEVPPAYDPLELGRSALGVDWILHES